jgi:mRNA-degrading endonuclease RelE of RelBE toxin-antitoxin system
MIFELHFSKEAKDKLRELKGNKSLAKQYKAVQKALKNLQRNPSHPSLQTHPYTSLNGPNREKVFEAYAEQDTPTAYRIFFCYGSLRGVILILTIVPHP